MSIKFFKISTNVVILKNFLLVSLAEAGWLISFYKMFYIVIFVLVCETFWRGF